MFNAKRSAGLDARSMVRSEDACTNLSVLIT